MPLSESAPRIAVLTTEYSPRSHADVIVSRWLKPEPTDAGYGWPGAQTRIASLYVAQRPESDRSAFISREFGLPRYDTIAEALTLGGDKLAVDAVFLIGEHGSFPLNEYQQKMYPRKEMFDEALEVFRASGRVVPLFLDKHLSWNPRSAHEMYWRIKDEGIPFMGGSSLPYSPFRPETPLPSAEGYEEIVAFYFNELESYLFHSLEVVASLIERSPRGIHGLRQITAWESDDFWSAEERGEFSAALLDEAAGVISPEAKQEMQALRSRRGPGVHAFQLIYEDGLKVTHIMQPVVKKWPLACRSRDGRIASAYLDPGTRAEFHPSFARFNRRIEDFILGAPPFPLERLYLTTMATAACMRAIKQPGQPFSAPWLRIPPLRNLDCDSSAGKNTADKL